MVNSVLEQHQISDFLDWNRTKSLSLNPYFQRRRVWSHSAKVDLIDTILRGFPMPKVYLRQRIDLASMTSLREVVDGQQRLSTIFEFADDKITLNKRAREFAGLKYSDLEAIFQEAFLSYPIAVEQLVNASDDDVLEVFARLNSYTLPLNSQELRHATFSGDFKWAVNSSARRWSILWDQYEIVSTRERVRMADDQLMAEMYGVILDGVTDGGQPNIKKLYERMENNFPDQDSTEGKMDLVLSYFVDHLADSLKGTAVLRSPHFLMLFSALAHSKVGLPIGGIGNEMPNRSMANFADMTRIYENLTTLAGVLETPEPEATLRKPSLRGFKAASASSTQRISSRKTRFLTYFKALTQHPL